jgi:hypothetical protein
MGHGDAPGVRHIAESLGHISRTSALLNFLIDVVGVFSPVSDSVLSLKHEDAGGRAPS